MKSFFRKLENNKGADLQLVVVVLMLIFMFAIFMAMDFWMASTAKIIIIKETQAAEVYCLVKTVQGNYTKLQEIMDPTTAFMGTYQAMAIEKFGQPGGTDENPRNGEIYSRLKNIDYLKTYTVTDVRGVSQSPVGHFGIYMKMKYTTRNIIRAPQDIIGWFFRDKKNIENTANKEITLAVSAKVVPMIWDR